MADDVAVLSSKKWVQGTRTFKSSVTLSGDRGAQGYIPDPIMKMWGYPKYVIYQIQGDNVVMRKAKESTR